MLRTLKNLFKQDMYTAPEKIYASLDMCGSKSIKAFRKP